jgi:uncharacterized protein (DUF2147 family)
VRTAEAAAAVLATLLLSAAPLRAESADPRGDWYTEDHRGVIHFGPCGAYLCGTVEGISDWQKDGSAPTDVHGRSQCHLAIIEHLRPGDDGRLHGTVTDPTDGKTYSAIVWIGDDGALRLRGYIGLPVLGSTQRWEKFPGRVGRDCHFTR